MNQTIAVIIIVAVVAAYIIFSLIRNLLQKSKEECGVCCTCSAKNEIKEAIERKNGLVA